MMNPSPPVHHLEGSLLEALAAGSAAAAERALAQPHLDACPRCREELAALRTENTRFAAYFSDEEAGLRRASHSMPVRRQRVFLLAVAGVAAASVLAVAGWLALAQTPASARIPTAVAEEQPAPKPVQQPEVPPKPETKPEAVVVPKVPEVVTPEFNRQALREVAPVTYQGKTAGEWLKILRVMGPDKGQARYALSRIGTSVLPELLAMLRDGTEAEKYEAGKVLAELNDRRALPECAKLLKDPNWEVRMHAVLMLKPFVLEDEAAVAALKGALNDNDKAVAEAAEQALGPLWLREAYKDVCSREELAKFEQDPLKVREARKQCQALEEARELKTQALEALKQRKYAEATKLLNSALQRKPQDGQALQLLEEARLMATKEEMGGKGMLRLKNERAQTSTIGEEGLPERGDAKPRAAGE